MNKNWKPKEERPKIITVSYKIFQSKDTITCRKCYSEIIHPLVRLEKRYLEELGVYAESQDEMWCPKCGEWTWVGEAWQHQSLNNSCD